MSDLHLAFISIARPTFDIEFAKEKTDAARANLLGAGMDLSGPEGLVMDTAQVKDCIQELRGSPLDLLVIFQATFADSSMVKTIAKELDTPLLLWAVPEPHTGGRLRLNSFCGINLAGQALTRAGFWYEYVYANPDDPSVVDTIETLARAGHVRRLLRGARVGRIGENPQGFETCLYDPKRLKKIFGVEIVQYRLQEDIFHDLQNIKPSQTQAVRDTLARVVSNLDEMNPEATQKSLSTYLTLQHIAKRDQLNGFAVRCWPEFFTDVGCAACGAMSMLTDEMTPCSCEADVNGTVTLLMLQWLSHQPAFLTDMVSVDQARDALVLWHCGLAPLSMADPEKEKRVTIHSNRELPLLMEFPLKPGRVTVARISEATGDYRLVVGSGEMIRAPQSFSGTSGLLHFDKPADQIIETILHEGLEHHISITYGNYLPELCALANMFDIPILHLT
ncbi:MAG: L-fucose/L-arabinose isomerase family protein [Anaerolineales bacterium]